MANTIRVYKDDEAIAEYNAEFYVFEITHSGALLISGKNTHINEFALANGQWDAVGIEDW